MENKSLTKLRIEMLDKLYFSSVNNAALNQEYLELIRALVKLGELEKKVPNKQKAILLGGQG